IYNIAYGERIDLKKLASLMMNEISFNIQPIYKPVRPGDIRDSLADISAAKRDLGYLPQFTLQRGLQETITWYKNRSLE
ncbi:MAG: GDP-mannose 4,6-dehydratase, partial [Methanomicrobiales archaeon]|nr:GDP-mannose 4,6-dehydratase [Methanomicrobiales archaeon]